MFVSFQLLLRRELQLIMCLRTFEYEAIRVVIFSKSIKLISCFVQNSSLSILFLSSTIFFCVCIYTFQNNGALIYGTLCGWILAH